MATRARLVGITDGEAGREDATNDDDSSVGRPTADAGTRADTKAGDEEFIVVMLGVVWEL